MCGIAGILGRPDRLALSRMTASMVHRGPDDDGTYSDEDIALGFRRLAIIDVAGGRQPMANEDGSIHAVFNGEIYNHRELRQRLEARGHRFASGADGEVLTHLYEEYGAALVKWINGIFAFAIWDRPARRLLLARDPHGVKPLYFAERGGQFLFASELKAMLASRLVERTPDVESVAQYLVHQVVPPPRTMVSGVQMLPPGSLLLHDSAGVTVRAYWEPPRQNTQTVSSIDEAAELVRHGLDQAVGRQMMSERPLGLFLSGGIDSSALVALAAGHTRHRLKTFSVAFAGPEEEVFSEQSWARMVADRYGTEHHEFILTEGMFRARMPAFIEAMDQPTADGVNSYFVSLAAARQVTVALSGTGSDELFLGYPRDAALLADHAQARSLAPLPAAYVQAVARLLPDPDRLWPGAARLVRAARTYGSLDAELMTSRGIGLFDDATSRNLLLPGLRGTFTSAASGLRAAVQPDPARPGDWLLRAEQRAYLSHVLLRDIDAMSMAHSLEVRVPFLDVAFGASLAAIPWQWKLRDGIGKWILRRALADLLPGEILNRPKMGFGLPYNVWMRRSIQPMVRDVLARDTIGRRGLFDPAAVSRLVHRFYGGDDTVWRHVWALFVLESWMAQALDAPVAMPLAMAS
jgi:asparagine synthase (glutamine-hydrolysing)